MPGNPHPRADGRAHTLRRTAAGVCLAAPVIALLWVPSYARRGPELAGVPFFYWYQLAWVPGCGLGLLIAYLLLRGTGRQTRCRDQ
ncbi:DUF3311 domain-containing protein [Embleya sp. NBC_00896]|uniref:DUF3311 domain-containing protein n=1 Tax=Embleya sp. NBC_00896 TaxID=2975961 RepID=UPI00386CF046|nr:DUF3311 domain-containing protein [Embleya sp. NBC_00896]